MTIEKVDEWLKMEYGMSYTELMKSFFTLYKNSREDKKEIKHLNDQLDQALKELDICQQGE